MICAIDRPNRYIIRMGYETRGSSGIVLVSGHHISIAEEIIMTCSTTWTASLDSDASYSAGKCHSENMMIECQERADRVGECARHLERPVGP